MSLIEMNTYQMPHMGSALHSPVAPIAARILPSNEGERGLLGIAKRPNSKRIIMKMALGRWGFAFSRHGSGLW